MGGVDENVTRVARNNDIEKTIPNLGAAREFMPTHIDDALGATDITVNVHTRTTSDRKRVCENASVPFSVLEERDVINQAGTDERTAPARIERSRARCFTPTTMSRKSFTHRFHFPIPFPPECGQHAMRRQSRDESVAGHFHHRVCPFMEVVGHARQVPEHRGRPLRTKTRKTRVRAHSRVSLVLRACGHDEPRALACHTTTLGCACERYTVSLHGGWGGVGDNKDLGPIR